MNLHTETIVDLQRAADLLRRGEPGAALADIERTIDRLNRANIPLRDIPGIKRRIKWEREEREGKWE